VRPLRYRSNRQSSSETDDDGFTFQQPMWVNVGSDSTTCPVRLSLDSWAIDHWFIFCTVLTIASSLVRRRFAYHALGLHRV